MNSLLIIGLTLAFFILFGVLSDSPQNNSYERVTVSQKTFITALCIVSTTFLYIIIYLTGPIAILISILTGILLYLISYAVFEDDAKIRNIWNKDLFLNKPVLSIKNKYYFAVVLILLVFSLILSLSFSLQQSLQITYGSVYSLILPGFLLTHLFFPSQSIDLLERLALSFALSISIVPLLIFYLNLIGMPISTVSTLSVIFILSGIIGGMLIVKKKNN